MDRLRSLFFPLISLTLVLFSSCQSGHRRTEVDASAVSVPVMTVNRYDLDLFGVDPGRLRQDLEALRPRYRFFLDTDLGDTAKLSEMRAYLANPRNLEFHKAVAGKYGDVSDIGKELAEAFRHYRYYYPGAAVPRVYAYISGGDYDFPVRFADSVLLIGFDNYLGKDFKAYAGDGLPYYRIVRMTREQVIPDCMHSLANVAQPSRLPGNTLLEQMVEAGKRLYFVDAMIPATDDRFKIGFTDQQYDWIKKNEQHVWASIIENRMLYTTDAKFIRVFMADGPFTAEFSKEAPPRLGEWIGWQIVRNYMENQRLVTLRDMMNEPDAQKILSLSGYKPEK